MPLPATYFGMPLLEATPELVRAAVMLGERIEITPEFSAYRYQDKIVVVSRDDEKPKE